MAERRADPIAYTTVANAPGRCGITRGERLRRWQQRLREPCLTALVVLELGVIFVVAPLTATGLLVPSVLHLLPSLLIVAAVVVVSRYRVAVVIMVGVTAVGWVLSVIHQAQPSVLMTVLTVTAILAFLAVLTWVVGSAVFGPGRVTWYRIQGAIAIYLQIGLLFTYLCLLLVACIPDAFSPAIVPHEPAGMARLLYFSFVTLTSTGYGDVVPLHPFARSVAMLEAVIGQLFPATLLARLVTLELEARRH